MFQYFILILNILGIILTAEAQSFRNHLKVSTRLDLSGSLKHLCAGDDQNDDDQVVSCACLSKLSVVSTVQVGKYQNVYHYNESNQYGVNTYASLHQTEEDLEVFGFGRFNLHNVKCVENNEVKDVESRYTHWFHVYYTWSSVATPNKFVDYEDYEAEVPLPVTIVDINLDNAPKIRNLIVKLNSTEVYKFEDNLGTMCGESLEKGSMERALWSIVDQVLLHNDNNCNYPKGSTFPTVEKIPLTMIVDKPLKCGQYVLEFSIHLDDLPTINWIGKIYWYLEAGSTCVG
ncbi:uncharacterized protein LOC123270759 [Cotesia glomerata]|uniref:uncharacterized protein LOC123270759 n=1 Tax=Cotesia glomerata TaxID=32391 RepID=UPI001D0108A2|nr:uncharacterized protein LOC123270759 [Cotesia glomerata]